MDILSLRRRIERLIHMDSSVFTSVIQDSGFECLRCGWCCRENFNIRVTQNILRPSNAISIFPDDIRHIVKNTGMLWDEIAEPDIYSCLSDGESVRVIGWILRRNEAGDCIFYRNGECTIYEWRPMICRCYPFFVDDSSVDIMHCEGLHNKKAPQHAAEMGLMLKRYEIKKLQSFIRIISQVGDMLNFQNLCSLQQDYSGEVLVNDGEAVSVRRLK